MTDCHRHHVMKVGQIHTCSHAHTHTHVDCVRGRHLTERQWHTSKNHTFFNMPINAVLQLN